MKYSTQITIIVIVITLWFLALAVGIARAQEYPPYPEQFTGRGCAVSNWIGIWSAMDKIGCTWLRTWEHNNYEFGMPGDRFGDAMRWASQGVNSLINEPNTKDYTDGDNLTPQEAAQIVFDYEKKYPDVHVIAPCAANLDGGFYDDGVEYTGYFLRAYFYLTGHEFRGSICAHFYGDYEEFTNYHNRMKVVSGNRGIVYNEISAQQFEWIDKETLRMKPLPIDLAKIFIELDNDDQVLGYAVYTPRRWC